MHVGRGDLDLDLASLPFKFGAAVGLGRGITMGGCTRRFGTTSTSTKSTSTKGAPIGRGTKDAPIGRGISTGPGGTMAAAGVVQRNRIPCCPLRLPLPPVPPLPPLWLPLPALPPLQPPLPPLLFQRRFLMAQISKSNLPGPVIQIFK